ncbi:MAG: glycosyltransferase family 2 protein [Gaiellaceae bacterium]
MLSDVGEGLPDDYPTFSVIIPAFNEIDDIGACLQALSAQRWPVSEIIVVDGLSTDGTLEFLRAQEAAGRLRLVEETKRGPGAARNAGLRVASGDAVVILNADVLPEPDFLERIAPHYRKGYGSVSVESRVLNLDSVIPRFIQADHELSFGGNRKGNVGWTEGFSCLREDAVATLFPDQIPVAGGEDVVFFNGLLSRGIRWTGDFSVVIPHRAPASWTGFWRQWVARGASVPHIEHTLAGMSVGRVAVRRIGAMIVEVLRGLVIVPALLASIRCARLSGRGWRDALPFWILIHVRTAAHRIGTLRGLGAIARDGG